MVPHTALGAQQLKHLKVYAGPTHPHRGQAEQIGTAESEGEATS
jgi:large subunit ribosomal protein L13